MVRGPRGNGGRGTGFASLMDAVPPFRLPLPRELTPRQALAALRGMPGRVLLETATGGGGRTLLSADPPTVVRWVRGQLEVEGGGRMGFPGAAILGRDPFAFLSASTHDRGGGPGGWIGYVGYEVADHLEQLPPPPAGGAGLPDLRFGAHDWWVVWDRAGGLPVLEGAPLPGDKRARGKADLRERMEEVQERLLGVSCKSLSDHEIVDGSHGPDRRRTSDLGALVQLPEGVSSSLPHAAYLKGVERVRAHIRDGDLFQANLTQLLQCPVSVGGEALYHRLLAESPAPFAAFLDTGVGEIASISPESFLSVRGDRVTTRPIKGTIRRNLGSREDGSREDAKARASLRASEKDQAENVMIVDLLRNDLSRVARPGSVQVPRLLEVETHPTVHHLVSTVTARLRPGVGIHQLLGATFPGGSITGAPKIRALEILRSLEPLPRGVYTGSLGLVTFQGDAELSIAIRTAVVADGHAWYGTGGGVTLASDPEAEWQESLAKAAPFLRALGGGEAKRQET
jgi:para-aminobenzoate synthetase component I